MLSRTIMRSAVTESSVASLTASSRTSRRSMPPPGTFDVPVNRASALSPASRTAMSMRPRRWRIRICAAVNSLDESSGRFLSLGAEAFRLFTSSDNQ